MEPFFALSRDVGVVGSEDDGAGLSDSVADRVGDSFEDSGESVAAIGEEPLDLVSTPPNEDELERLIGLSPESSSIGGGVLGAVVVGTSIASLSCLPASIGSGESGSFSIEEAPSEPGMIPGDASGSSCPVGKSKSGSVLMATNFGAEMSVTKVAMPIIITTKATPPPTTIQCTKFDFTGADSAA
jgi:hypothetical protein